MANIVREADLRNAWTKTETAGKYSRVVYGTPFRENFFQLIKIFLLVSILVPVLFNLLFGTTMLDWWGLFFN